MKNISYEQLKKTHGDKAKEIIEQIAEIGGFGKEMALNSGGLDLTDVPEKTLKEITELAKLPKEK